jgi:hypothetical protein
MTVSHQVSAQPPSGPKAPPEPPETFRVEIETRRLRDPEIRDLWLKQFPPIDGVYVSKTIGALIFRDPFAALMFKLRFG